MKGVFLFLVGFLISIGMFAQSRYDVVIDEIMADPSPAVGLPNSEWIELKNTTANSINLGGWSLGDASSQSSSFADFILRPGGFVIICNAGAVNGLSAFGETLPIGGFPSLDNNGGLIFLRDAGAHTIHAVEYVVAWYQNALKEKGGWSLEMMDTQRPCLGETNWEASIDPAGGTPGRENSVHQSVTDDLAPQLREGITFDSVSIVVEFNEPVDSVNASAPGHYHLDGGLIISQAFPLAPIFNAVQLTLIAPMQPGIIYHLTVDHIIDCSGNILDQSNEIKIGLPQAASASDIVINEILFNPTSNGYDYVEFFNRSQKIVNLSELSIANRNTDHVISSIEQIQLTPRYLFPGDYLVVTENASSLSLNYLVKDPSTVIEVATLPSYPDDEGDVVLLNAQGEIVDEVNYSSSWHFKLIGNPEGISLERVDPEKSSMDESNWHSASSTAGYGTPGYKNSQSREIFLLTGAINILPKIFSPDNDGHDDETVVQYQFEEAGFVANVVIFDLEGRPVRNLVKNEPLGTSGQWIWDGLDEKNNRLPVGRYIVCTEIFNLKGKHQHYKNLVIIAAKFN